MHPFHITFSLDLLPFREAPYFPAAPKFKEHTITDPALKKTYESANNPFKVEWKHFVKALSSLIILHTKHEFERYRDAAGLTEDKKNTAWNALCRSAAFFGVTNLFSLHEFLKNSLEADADTVRFHISWYKNKLICIISDDGTGFTHKKFRTLFEYKHAAHAEPILDYASEVMENDRGIASPKKIIASHREEIQLPDFLKPSKNPQRDMRFLKPIDEEHPTTWGLIVGGGGRGLAITLQAMAAGKGSLYLTNVERLGDISGIAALRQNMDEFGRGGAIILSSPLMNDSVFSALKAREESFRDKPPMLYFLNLAWDRMNSPSISPNELRPLKALEISMRLRAHDGSVRSLSFSDLQVAKEKEFSAYHAAPAAPRKKTLRRRESTAFFGAYDEKKDIPPADIVFESKKKRPPIPSLILDLNSEEDTDEVIETLPLTYSKH